MPAIGFQKQFVMPILTGSKTSTIRKPRKDRRMTCKSGDVVKLYYGMRTKQCELISEVKCTAITSIRLETSCLGQLVVFKGGQTIRQEQIRDLWRMEGFERLLYMRDWFIKHHKIDEQPFIGWQIQWEAL